MSVQLSKRLAAAAALVTPGSRLADVGCDHGYVTIVLLQSGVIPSAIAMDANEGPLARAAQHVAEAGLADRVSLRLSDGLAALSPGEADTVLMAGMGGRLIIRILEDGICACQESAGSGAGVRTGDCRSGEDVPAPGDGGGNARTVPDSVRELILQPQSETGDVRRWLLTHAWEITEEDMVFEEGKYYPMMRAVHAEKSGRMREGGFGWDGPGLAWGKLLLENRHPVLLLYLNQRLATCRVICERIEREGSPAAEVRRREIEAEMRAIEETVEAYYG